jgi:hypothetical protein
MAITSAAKHRARLSNRKRQARWYARQAEPVRSVYRVELGREALMNKLIGHPTVAQQSPLLGVKRTSRFQGTMSAFDPKRTSALFRRALEATHFQYREFDRQLPSSF